MPALSARGCFAIIGLAFGAASIPAVACADDALPPFGGTPLAKEPGSIEVGGFVFRPLVAVRMRAEVWSDPPIAPPTAVLAPTPTTGFLSRPDVLIAERSRLGIAAERGPVSAVVTVQDAREYGSSGSVFSDTFGLPSFEPYEAYLDVHTSDRDVFFRLGRQEVLLGDGRLIGISDESPKGRSLDAARLGARWKNVDLQAFAAMLAMPRLHVSSDSTGAQLYALDATFHVVPLFGAEVSALGRVVRGTADPTLTPSSTFVPWVRFFGNRRGLSYSIDGAFEAGNVAFPANVRTQIAGAVAGRVDWETALPWRLTFGVDGAYASGRNPAADPTKTTDHAFDPILPDTTEHYGQSGFVAWTNQITAAGDVAISPHDAIRFKAGYRFAGLAEPHGMWFSSSLMPVGSSPTNTSHVLGHIIEASAVITPWAPLVFKADYAALIPGDGAKAIFKNASSNAPVLHYGLVEATARLP